MRKLILVSLLLLLPKLVSAQTVYCDTTPPTSGAGTIGVPEKVDACISPNDSSTPPNPVTPTGWTLYVNSVGQAITMSKVNETATSGLIHYTGSYTPSAAGTQSIQVTATGNGKESNKSNIFTLTISAPLSAPQAPVKLSTQ